MGDSERLLNLTGDGVRLYVIMEDNFVFYGLICLDELLLMGLNTKMRWPGSSSMGFAFAGRFFHLGSESGVL